MEGISVLKDLLRPNHWIVMLDLKDAYFCVPMHEEVSSLQVGKLHKGIQQPCIWIRPSSSQLHEDIQASSSISPKEGNAFAYIHRRHNNPESESAVTDKGQGYSDIDSPVFRVCDKLGEVASGTNSEVRISRHVDRLCNYDSVPTREEVVSIIQKCQCLLSKTVVMIREVSELIGMLPARARAVLSAPFFLTFFLWREIA